MMRICTFNIKNNYRTYNSKKAKQIVQFLKEYKIDVLCFQELFSKCRNDLHKEISSSSYQIYGNYRYKLKIMSLINEAVAILTNKKVIGNKTYKLPFLPSTLKRIATKIIIDDPDLGKVAIINTHLDFMYQMSKKRQLKKLLQIIKKEKLPIVLTGDFNLKNNNPIFNNFVSEVEKLGLKRVAVNEKTLKQSRYNRAIDHIFISKCFSLKKLEVIKNLEISDHYPVLIDIETIH